MSYSVELLVITLATIGFVVSIVDGQIFLSIFFGIGILSPTYKWMRRKSAYHKHIAESHLGDFDKCQEKPCYYHNRAGES
jgi:hypothetical protein